MLHRRAVGSSLPIFWVDAAVRRGSQRGLRAGLALSGLMGAAFLVLHGQGLPGPDFGWRDNAYGSIYYTIVGLHALHVFVGLLLSLIVQMKAWRGNRPPTAT